MPNASGERLVVQYLDLFCQVAAKSAKGEDVSRQSSILLENAAKQLSAWRGDQRIDAKSELIRRLRMRAELLSRSAPDQSKVLMDVAEKLRSNRQL
ncbi:hypothetical protein BTHE68_40190 [Burkholderia sp. THE68]|uniref:hypothetical protein n=1 Tax=Burkholderia sp. THE68 TaxID=758782 RepID=UPI001316CDB9|nr:hypothetical protein [Burkholderia sp. THE68]BBU30285.1 hypothetical protein BTHE68_40190 [Burkholderia sp. THE68]